MPRLGAGRNHAESPRSGVRGPPAAGRSGPCNGFTDAASSRLGDPSLVAERGDVRGAFGLAQYRSVRSQERQDVGLACFGRGARLARDRGIVRPRDRKRPGFPGRLAFRLRFRVDRFQLADGADERKPEPLTDGPKEDAMTFQIAADFIAAQNLSAAPAVAEDYAALSRQLARRGVDLEAITAKLAAFAVAIPTWGVGTGGTRFARVPGPGEPRGMFDKLEDCAPGHPLTPATPTCAPQFP